MSSSSSSSSASKTPVEISMAAVFGKKFVTGCFGGVCQAVCSAPFDLIKTRMQSGQYDTIVSAVKETLAKEGPLAFYKGVGPPIAISGVYNAVLFASNETARKLLIRIFDLDITASKPLPLQYIMLSGVLTAPTACAILTPADRIKIFLQLQKEAKGKAKYSGMVDCVVKISKEEGLHSLMRGYLPTLGTRAFGLPFYFGANDVTRKFWKRQNPNSSDFATSMVGGIMAGWAFWCTILPFDVVKTKVQGQQIVVSGTTEARRKSAMDFVREIHLTSGFKGFYRGLGSNSLEIGAGECECVHGDGLWRQNIETEIQLVIFVKIKLYLFFFFLRKMKILFYGFFCQVMLP